MDKKQEDDSNHCTANRIDTTLEQEDIQTHERPPSSTGHGKNTKGTTSSIYSYPGEYKSDLEEMDSPSNDKS